MIKSLDFYFDFVSPYSYLAYKKIKSELKKLTQDVFNKGVFGAPTFIVNKKKNLATKQIIICFRRI